MTDLDKRIREYAKWRTVLDCLYPRAFPLTPTTAPYPYYDAENAIRQFRKEKKS